MSWIEPGRRLGAAVGAAVGIAAVLAAALGTAGCVERIRRKVSPSLSTVDKQSPFLKVHMRNGDVYVLRRWDLQGTTLSGFGQRQGVDRQTSAEQTHAIPMGDVALFETNVVATSPSIAALAVIGTVSVAVSVACLTNWKACFGSCPTFYAPDAKTGRRCCRPRGSPTRSRPRSSPVTSTRSTAAPAPAARSRSA